MMGIHIDLIDEKLTVLFNQNYKRIYDVED